MHAYPQAYIDYLVYFHGARDYFECHEVMEAYWKEQLHDPQRAFHVALIQIAVSLYHQRRGNFAGASKMLAGAQHKVSQANTNSFGLDHHQLTEILSKRMIELEKGTVCDSRGVDTSFTDVNLPIIDYELKQHCMHISAQRGWMWEQASDLSDTFLIEKHRLRDRTEVIAERHRQKHLKSQ